MFNLKQLHHVLSIGLLYMVCMASQTLLAQHVENPYLLRYGDDIHWSQELPWHETINASSIENLYALDENKEWAVDSAVLHQYMQKLSDNGGGVIYFPPGIYRFAYDVVLPSRVVLRGAEPKGVKDGKSEYYRLQTFFEFPAYKPLMSRAERDTLVFEDVSNETAFKRILAQAGATEFGLVNLDLNRVVIDWSLNSKTNNNSSKYHSKLILFGIRQNNAVIPDPKVPSKFQEEIGNSWQRWPHSMIGNINLSVDGPILIANCRFNDKVTDSYRQLGYKVDDGMSFDGSYAVFDYSDHIGIHVDQPDDGMSRSGIQEVSLPIKTPKTHVEMRDNFMRLRKGNNFIHGNASIKSVGNDMAHYQPPHQSRVKDGVQAIETYYDVLLKAPERTEAGIMVYKTGDTLPYRLMKPMNYDPSKSYPLVIFLHGSGERGTDNWAQLQHFSWFWAREETQKNYPCFVLMPQHSKKYMSMVGGFDTEADTWMTMAMFDVMDELQGKYPIDPARTYLTGISSGAFSVWELICHFPERFAAAVPIAGYKRFNEFSRRKRKQEKNSAKSVPIWAFHGSLDEWIPPNYARITISELKKAGASPRYTQFEGVGHLCWDDIAKVDGFLPWLFDQKKTTTEKP